MIEGSATAVSADRRGPPPMRTMVHGFEASLQAGSDYPEIVARFPWFNAPLVELVHQVWLAKAHGVCVVDVGAGVGDTVLLLKQRCCDAVAQFICVEGDPDFFVLLEDNVRLFSDVVAVQRLLAREDRSIPSLVKHRASTAIAAGSGWSQACRLDAVSEVSRAAVDVLKIDVDGFDGEVLAGATELLTRCAPAVIFEWHPRLQVAAGFDCVAAFEALQSCGYDRYLWFNNIGTFSHFEEGYSVPALRKLAGYLLEVNSRADEHFDVVALHRTHGVDEIGLAATAYARQVSAMG